MKDEVLAHLHGILQEARAVKQFVANHTFESYCDNELVRSAVERKFEIIGEALNRIKRDDPDMLSWIRNFRDIISFRNILVHGYDAIDDRIVWGVIEEDHGNLRLSRPLEIAILVALFLIKPHPTLCYLFI